MYWYDDNKYLSQSEQLHNAQNVVTLLYQSGKGWTKESICAILGNMSQESNVNPNLYEKGYTWAQDKGYGLVQWTPRSKYWNWATSNNLDPKSAISQIKRISYEIDNNIQWIKKQSYPITFREFVTNSKNKDIEYLVKAFMYNYERPNLKYAKLENRIAFAKLCYNKLKFNSEEVDDTPSGGNDNKVPNNIGDVESFARKMIQIIDNLIDKINEDFTYNLSDIDNMNFISNGKVKVFRYNNLYKISYDMNFLEKIKDSIKELENQTGNNNNDFPSEKEPDKPSTNTSENVKKLIAKAQTIPLNSVRYSMGGARDMKKSGDCSSFTRYIFKAVNINIGNVCAEQYSLAKQRNKLIFDGYSNKINELIEKAKPGDFILMTRNRTNFVTGGASHVVFVLDDNTIIHQSASPTGYGPRKDNLKKYIKALVNAGYGRWALVRYF